MDATALKAAYEAESMPIPPILSPNPAPGTAPDEIWTVALEITAPRAMLKEINDFIKSRQNAEYKILNQVFRG